LDSYTNAKKSEIIQISLKYQILSKYTAFLIIKNEGKFKGEERTQEKVESIKSSTSNLNQDRPNSGNSQPSASGQNTLKSSNSYQYQAPSPAPSSSPSSSFSLSGLFSSSSWSWKLDGFRIGISLLSMLLISLILVAF
jgi:hypothetical protein